jgi:hypothetical protein
MPKLLGLPNERPVLQKLAFEGRYLNSRDIILMLENTGFAYINKGKECIVINHEGNPQEVIAINYQDILPQEQKIVFYFQRIFSILFPHNFPKFGSAFTNHVGQINIRGTVRNKVHSAGNDAKPIIKFPFSQILSVCKEIGIDLHIDKNSKNFIIGNDGGEYYVDTINFDRAKITDPDRVILYMSANNFSSDDIEAVKKSLLRINTIAENFNAP